MIEAEATSTPDTDDQVRHDVIEELDWSARLHGAEIHVDVTDGVATLSGTVPTLAAGQAAVRLAQDVRGVGAVADELRVELRDADRRIDTEIALAIRHALLWDVRVPEEQIRVAVTDGIVRLEGTVDSWAAYGDATRCAVGITGVRGLITTLVVAPRQARVEGPRLERAIQRALDRRAEHLAKHVKVFVEHDDVRLEGTCGSVADHDAVVGAVRGTKGVGRIRDCLMIAR